MSNVLGLFAPCDCPNSNVHVLAGPDARSFIAECKSCGLSLTVHNYGIPTLACRWNMMQHNYSEAQAQKRVEQEQANMLPPIEERGLALAERFVTALEKFVGKERD